MIGAGILRALELLGPDTFVDVDVATFCSARASMLNECVLRGLAGSRLVSKGVRRYWRIDGALLQVSP